MKICHVCICTVFWERYAYHDNLLPKYHSKLGHQVSIIASTDCRFSNTDTRAILREPVGEYIIEDNIKLIRIKSLLPANLNKHFHICYGLYSAVSRENPDFIFVHSINSPNYRIFLKYKKKHPNVVIVFDNHADMFNSCQNKFSLIWAKCIIRKFVANYIKKISNCFYGVTPSRCHFLRDIYGIEEKKIRLLPMGADDENMHIDEKMVIRSNIREQYGIEKDDFLIVTGGKIDRTKNIHTLAKAVSEVNNENIKLLIFGSISDDLINVFKEYESERIIQVGWVDSSTVYNYFYAADLVMFPGLHSVLWEQAVASKVPCAFKKINGFEHVDIGGNCIWLTDTSCDYYLNVIKALAEDKDNYSHMQNSALSDKSSYFLYSSLAKKVLDDNLSINAQNNFK